MFSWKSQAYERWSLLPIINTKKGYTLIIYLILKMVFYSIDFKTLILEGHVLESFLNSSIISS